VLDVEDLRTFVEVADAGGVSSAARRLGVSKSIVSRRLFRLEAELGVQLLARTTRGAALTEAGVTFRDHAARVCAEIDIARETILPAGDLRGRADRSAADFRHDAFGITVCRTGAATPAASCACELQ
jgi:DNA-binding transcriptional LysR family regulator